MKILWFTNTPSRYKVIKAGYNGGGWISSLEQEMSNNKEIELAVSFMHPDKIFKAKEGSVTYYPISISHSFFKKIKGEIFQDSQDKKEVASFLEIINDFKPDIIHVFGSERSFGLISKYTDIPVVIHIQGILNPYLNAWFPPGTNVLDYFRYNNLVQMLKILKFYRVFKHNSKREVEILSNCNYFLGRTDWDKAIVNIYSPLSKYFYCSEILRSVFYASEQWKVQKRKTIKLISTISKSDYKGYDVVLKTARLLKEIMGVEFEWNVYGIKEYRFWERKLGFKSVEVNVNLLGVVSADQLVENILQSSIYVHPSYIDNSPNSVCEAQIIGIPVIAGNVGGMSSIIKDGISGILVPSNDPFTLAAKIIELNNDNNLCSEIGINARTIAMKRHNITDIVQQNMSVYKLLFANAINQENV
ncbi:glycosyltransferase family 4 protein [Pedobacter sp. P26]|uniref:glycosyltransferase family 4 protein n=1 Tax=Pedobacter sp. P26 TaxID=3423956 RepID=UPI003D667323